MKSVAPFLVAALLLSACKDVGCRELDVTTRSRASAQAAREVMAQIQQGLHSYYETKHHYPETNEMQLFDSIRNYVSSQIDPLTLYRNDNGKGYFIAVGSRAGRMVYRYPPTIGVG